MSNSNINLPGEDPIPCITCDVVDVYTENGKRFIEVLSESMVAPMTILFFSVVGLWIVIQGYKLILGHMDLAQLLKEFVFVLIAFFMLQSQDSDQGNGLILNVFSASLEMMGGFASIPFSISDGGLSESVRAFTGMTRLTAFAEFGFYKILQAAGSIMDQGGLFSVKNFLMAGLLILPYFLMLIAFAAQLVVGVFRLIVVAAFAPFLVLAFGFGWGRGMFYSGLKVIISAIAVLFACSVSIGLLMFGVSGLTEEIELLKNGGVELSFRHPTFIVIIFLGYMGTAFMAEATGIANSITGTFLTNQAAGIITGGVTGTAGAAAKATAKAPGALMDAPGKIGHRAEQLKTAGSWARDKAIGPYDAIQNLIDKRRGA